MVGPGRKVAATGVLALNIVLTITAIGIAYRQNGHLDGQYLHSASLYQGSCTRSKNWAIGLHLIINILSTVLLAASNYCLQSLSAPSRAEIDEAHNRREWLSVGVPNISKVLFHQPAKRALLGLAILLTSLPTHLMYNSAIYYALAPRTYTAVVSSTNGTLSATLDSLSNTDRECFESKTGIAFEDFRTAYTGGRYRNLTKEECVNALGQDYVADQKAVIVMTDDIIPDALMVSGFANGARTYRGKDSDTYSWMCHGRTPCVKDEVMSQIDSWTVGAYHWAVTCSDPYSRYHRPDASYKVAYCLSIPAPETCGLRFNLPICLIVIGCNIAKVISMFLVSRDKRQDICRTVGDAISSFLDNPDKTTEGMCLLSKKAVITGRNSWKNRLLQSQFQPSVYTELSPFLPNRKQWFHAVSVECWLLTFLLSGIMLGLSAYLVKRSINNLRENRYSESIWDLGLGEIRIVSSLPPWIEGAAGSPSFMAIVLAANAPQLLVSMIYFYYNTLLTYMFLAAEYDRYATSSVRQPKYLRVSWPRGRQRSTYYLSLPYRHSIPFSIASSVLHWLVSQSLFFVEIRPVIQSVSALAFFPDTDAPPGGHRLMTCGFSGLAIVLAMILGACLLVVAVCLGLRRFESRMPLAVDCSAAISAACHPSTGEAEHALKPVVWGEEAFVLPLVRPVGTVEINNSERVTIANHGSSEDGYSSSDEEKIPHGHCSFTTEDVSEPISGRVYT